MTTKTYPHLEIIADRAWIRGRNVRVAEIVLDWLAHRWDAEEIHRQHPHLTMAEIHAAFVYYDDHQEELDREIAEELAKVEELKSQTQNLELQARLRSQRKSNFHYPGN